MADELRRNSQTDPQFDQDGAPQAALKRHPRRKKSFTSSVTSHRNNISTGRYSKPLEKRPKPKSIQSSSPHHSEIYKGSLPPLLEPRRTRSPPPSQTALFRQLASGPLPALRMRTSDPGSGKASARGVSGRSITRSCSGRSHISRNRLESGRHPLRRQEGIREDEQEVPDGPRLTKRLVSPDGWKRDQTHVKWYREHLHREWKVKAREEKLEEREESRVAKKIEEIRLLEVRREQREMENVEKRVKRTAENAAHLTRMKEDMLLRLQELQKQGKQSKKKLFSSSIAFTAALGTFDHSRNNNRLITRRDSTGKEASGSRRNSTSDASPATEKEVDILSSPRLSLIKPGSFDDDNQAIKPQEDQVVRRQSVLGALSPDAVAPRMKAIKPLQSIVEMDQVACFSSRALPWLEPPSMPKKFHTGETGELAVWEKPGVFKTRQIQT
eukprot:CAMPEP_0198207292 /NCGR_PEP_ID=MMETSP1445-20131203/10759_1 /TAXON_ID=36898 /ORGANISM="Pyramimonas sp., Strain CCMP2087" /LENGTH=440 /DNA_ID=CAMNT_0043880275 /DNA_START=381 /DNA_END=1703 /DNA_ORIENTATION=+